MASLRHFSHATCVRLRFKLRILGYFLAVGAFLSGAVVSSPAQTPQLLIENVTLIDGTSHPVREHACVLVKDHRVATLAPCPLLPTGNVRRIDGTGKFLLPGLIDVHVHLGRGLFDSDFTEMAGIRLLQGYLYCGVTSVMDVGSGDAYIFGLREKQQAGAFVSPRLFAAGGIVTFVGGAGKINPSATLLDSWPQSIPKLDAHIALKPDMISLIYDERGWGKYELVPIMPLDLARKTLEYYSDHGIRSMAHLFSELRAREAIEAGLDTLGNTIIEGPVSNGFVQLMAGKRVPIASALSSFDDLGRLMDHPEFLDQPLYRATLEPVTIEQLKTTTRDFLLKDPWWGQWRKLMEPIGADNLKRINAAGGIVALGTDVSVGPSVHRELELLVNGGISPGDAIRIATLNAAVFLGKDRELGSVEEGKLADLLLLDANPLADINNTKRISMVIVNGEVVNREALDLPVNRRSQTTVSH